MAPPMPPPDRSVLAGRIQGYGNFNPPPLEEDTAGTKAKKVVGNIGNILGEEVMLTIDDFKEKGAVGAVKDAVADAGDILIDGVSSIFGWVRGDPPEEDENPDAERAQDVLVNGPSGAAYGVQQASPTGGINAVWVMPEEADPKMLQELAQQSGGLDPRAPKNIQPYQSPAATVTQANNPMTLPNGQPIAPYQPPGGGPMIQPYAGGPQIQPYQAGAFRGHGYGAGGPAPFIPGVMPGAGNMPAGFPQSGGGAPTTSSASGAKNLIERVAKGDMLAGADVAKRLVGQCTAANMSAKQLGELICERARRLYLGLDGGDPSQSDACLVRLLGLTDGLAQQDSKFAADAVSAVREGVSEEFMSLQSSVAHKSAAVPMLARIGLVQKATEMPDLLGGMSTAGPVETDLLGGFDAGPSSKAAPATTADLLAF